MRLIKAKLHYFLTQTIDSLLVDQKQTRVEKEKSTEEKSLLLMRRFFAVARTQLI